MNSGKPIRTSSLLFAFLVAAIGIICTTWGLLILPSLARLFALMAGVFAGIAMLLLRILVSSFIGGEQEQVDRNGFRDIKAYIIAGVITLAAFLLLMVFVRDSSMRLFAIGVGASIMAGQFVLLVSSFRRRR
jgi:hypothetical protein